MKMPLKGRQEEAAAGIKTMLAICCCYLLYLPTLCTTLQRQFIILKASILNENHVSSLILLKPCELHFYLL